MYAPNDNQGEVDHEFLIAGAGFSGLGAAIKLQEAGRTDFLVLERDERIGGTWWVNKYPGCACDVPTPFYSYSFAPNPEWSHFYARAGEIHTYIEKCADDYGVRDRIRTGVELTKSVWEEQHQRWRLWTSDGEELTARFVIGGFGGLSQPKLPEIEGIESFSGELMHSAAWDDSIALEGRKVAVIGTGASAIQLVPEVAKVAGKLDLYQRTPPWIFPKPDFPFGRLAKRLFKAIPPVQKLLRGGVYAFSESVAALQSRYPFLMHGVALAGKAHIRATVKDPATRKALTPDYLPGCKRMLVANTYYPAMNRENLELVTAGIEKIVPEGIVTADGVLHETDVLICSTGFAIEETFTELDVTGRDGITLGEAWKDGIESYRSTEIAGFPNMFVLSGPNSGTGSTSQVFMIECQLRFLLETLDAMDLSGAVTVEATAEAQDAYSTWIDEQMEGTVWLKGGCSSWYLDSRGRNRTLWPGQPNSFRRMLSEFERADHMLEPAKAPAAKS